MMPKWFKRLIYYWAYDTVRANIQRFEYWEYLLTEINPDKPAPEISTTARIRLPVARVEPNVQSLFPFEQIGDQLVGDFREFKVFIDPAEREVFVEGVSVRITSNYGGHRKWCKTKRSNFSFDKTPATRPICSVTVVEYNRETDDFTFKCETVKLVVNRRKRSVTVWDASVGGTNTAGFEEGFGPADPTPVAFRDKDLPASNVTPFQSGHRF